MLVYNQSTHIIVFYFLLAVQVTVLCPDNTVPPLPWISATTIGAIVNIAIQPSINMLQVPMLQQLLFSTL